MMIMILLLAEVLMPVSKFGTDRPDFEEYGIWYEDRFDEDLYGNLVQDWYLDQIQLGQPRLSDTEFWKQLLILLDSWNAEYGNRTDGYPLWSSKPSLIIHTKTLESVVNKILQVEYFGERGIPGPA